MNISKLLSLSSKILFFICFSITFIYCDNKTDEPTTKKEHNISFSLDGKKINTGDEILVKKEFIKEISQIESEFISIDADDDINLKDYSLTLTKLDHLDDKNIGIGSFCYINCYATNNFEKYTHSFDDIKYQKDEKLYISYIFSSNSKKGDYRVKLSLLKKDKEINNFILTFSLKEDLKLENNTKKEEELENINLTIQSQNQPIEVEEGTSNKSINVSIENPSNINYNDRLILLVKNVFNNDFSEISSIEGTKIEATKTTNLVFNADFSKLQKGTYKLYLRYYSSENGNKVFYDIESMDLTIKEKKTPTPTPPSPQPQPKPIIVSLEAKDIKELSYNEGASMSFDFAIKNISEKDYNGNLEIFAIKENTNNKINLHSIESAQISKKSTKDFNLNIDISKLNIGNYHLYFTYRKLDTEFIDIKFANLVVRETVLPNPIDDEDNEETTEDKESTLLLSSYTGQYCTYCSVKIRKVWSKFNYEKYKDRVIKVSLHSSSRLTGALYNREADEYSNFRALNVRVTGLPTVIASNRREVFPSEYELDEQLAIDGGLNSKLEATLTGNKLDYSFITKKIKNKTLKHNKENLKVIFWLLESDIKAYQINIGSEYQHNDVFIGTLDGKLWGSDIKLGKKYSASTVDISKMFKAGGKKLSVVAIVMDGDNKEFIDAVKVDIK